MTDNLESIDAERGRFDASVWRTLREIQKELDQGEKVAKVAQILGDMYRWLGQVKLLWQRTRKTAMKRAD